MFIISKKIIQRIKLKICFLIILFVVAVMACAPVILNVYDMVCQFKSCFFSRLILNFQAENSNIVENTIIVL